jgi:hypothetical protein
VTECIKSHRLGDGVLDYKVAKEINFDSIIAYSLVEKSLTVFLVYTQVYISQLYTSNKRLDKITSR